jgi:hypothetical protein
MSCNITHCMFTGFCCTHEGFDCDKTVLLCTSESEFLCLTSAGCLAPGVPDKGIGMVTEDDEICKIGCYCCNLGLMPPKTLCRGVSQCLCCYNVTALPFDEDYVSGPVCAVYGLQCAPKCGCCAPHPESAALVRIVKGVQEAAAGETQEEMER